MAKDKVCPKCGVSTPTLAAHSFWMHEQLEALALGLELCPTWINCVNCQEFRRMTQKSPERKTPGN